MWAAYGWMRTPEIGGKDSFLASIDELRSFSREQYLSVLTARSHQSRLDPFLRPCFQEGIITY